MHRRRIISGFCGFWVGVAVCLGIGEGGLRCAYSAQWQAGFAKVVITPDKPMWLTGYGGRNKPSEGKIHDLYAKAAALQDPSGHRVVFVSTDLIGIPAGMAKLVSEAVSQKHGLSRADLMLSCSHTHCGPALDDKLSHMLAMKESDWKLVRRNQLILNQKLISVIGKAIESLEPARLSTGSGTCQFASNRRPPIGLGPYDHDVPVLRATSVDGSRLRGVIFGYACHSTTLSFYKWCGDYSGFASIYLEERHPEAVALFFAGCGADQNPLPRRKVSLAQKYGRMLAVSVEKTIKGEMQPVSGSLGSEFANIDLEFESLPSAEELKKRLSLETTSRYERARSTLLLKEIQTAGALSKTYPYPVQVWKLGNEVTWVAMGGEVVVDYALRLKSEHSGKSTWVTGYANDVMAYIPSERVLAEGGYEGGSSMLYYQMPSRWKTGLEEQIVQTIRAMSQRLNAR